MSFFAIRDLVFEIMFNSLLNSLLDLLLPQKPLARELLAMSPDEFTERAGRAPGNAGKNIISLFDYRVPLVKEAVWMLKYRGNKKIAALLATLLYEELLAFLAEYAPLTNFTDPLLIPIPLSRKRERERGFNQCVLLTDELLRLDISPIKGSTAVLGRRGVIGRNFTLSLALQKTKDTPSQTKTESRAEREKNLRGCFAADAEVVRGRNIILIDDVATTGATIDEARRTLRAAGARKVIAFTIAH